jgi:arylsulfatase A-like enzyme
MQRPNIIFIVADDLGYADLGCYGGRGFDGAGKESVSPNLDKLAAAGMKFTQGYSNSPVCSPTRFALMTARWQYRIRGALDEPLKSNTALIGKWHLGYAPYFGPLKSGYEEFFGPMSGGVDYFTHCDFNGKHDLYLGEEEKREDGYLTDLLSQHAVDYVQRMSAGDKPFFLSLHYTAPHWPWETRDDIHVSPEVAKNLFHLSGGNIHSYRKMIHHMDEGIGQLVNALRANGQLDNTLIVFTSDNGGERFSDNWPLVGGKMDLTEGGIRVPYIAHWPAVIQPGRISQQHCLTMDWSATMLTAGGAKPSQPLDGVSLLPVLQGSAAFERPLYWRMNHRSQRAHRSGDWKYLKVDDHEYLFNIPADERERANHASRESQRLAQMRAQWESWAATMPGIPADATVSLGFGLKDMPQR